MAEPDRIYAGQVGQVSSSESDEPPPELHLKREKLRLPGNGHGTLTAQQREEIMAATDCNASVRKRHNWPYRALMIVGPAIGLDAAQAMAERFILDRAHRNHYNYEKRINQHKFIKVYIYIHDTMPP